MSSHWIHRRAAHDAPTSAAPAAQPRPDGGQGVRASTRSARRLATAPGRKAAAECTGSTPRRGWRRSRPAAVDAGASLRSAQTAAAKAQRQRRHAPYALIRAAEQQRRGGSSAVRRRRGRDHSAIAPTNSVQSPAARCQCRAGRAVRPSHCCGRQHRRARGELTSSVAPIAGSGRVEPLALPGAAELLASTLQPARWRDADARAGTTPLGGWPGAGGCTADQQFIGLHAFGSDWLGQPP